MNNFKWPSWAHPQPDGWIEFKADEIYPLFLVAMGVKEPTQYDLEMARLVATEHIHMMFKALTVLNMDTGGTKMTVRITGDKRWALRNYPGGEKEVIPGDAAKKHRDLYESGKMPK